MIRVGLPTFGCKANQADGEQLRDAIADALGSTIDVQFPRARAADGYSAVDVVVINTCTVTHTADADARQIIRRYRRESPGATIVVTGCYAQTDRDALLSMDEVDHVVGNVHKSALPALVARVVRGEAAEPALVRAGNREWNATLRDAAAIRSLHAGRSRPFLKVQDGCDYVCSFCIIPQARGASRSIPMDHVVDEVRRYEALGAREVVLTGIHLGHWGRDLRPRRRFGDMLRELLQRTDSARLRISSLEPNEVDGEVIALVRDHPRVCPHLHVPLQSGDDHILAEMRRVYRTPWYEGVVQRFRQAAPRGAFGIDVMVGFPGEDEERFTNTLRFLRGLDFSYLHVFPYSPRRGTAAATMPGQVEPRVKRERVAILTSLSRARRAAHAAASIGERRSVLVEDRRARCGRLRGFSEHYVPVLFDGPDDRMNELVEVGITGSDGHTAYGEALA